jgi:uncharacterized protein with PIN domain
VAIPCPRCGREYDVALFPYGRTIHCTCGSRVGVEPRVRDLTHSGPRFMADAMLGRLARWLRILGFDTAWEAHIADGDLVRRALEQDRVILTRDRALPEQWRVSGVYVLAEDEPIAQLRDVAAAFQLARRTRLFTRCSRCNTLLVRASREEARASVPPRVLEAQADLLRCPGCERFYWSGSHTRRMRRVVEEVLGPGGDGS